MSKFLKALVGVIAGVAIIAAASCGGSASNGAPEPKKATTTTEAASTAAWADSVNTLCADTYDRIGAIGAGLSTDEQAASLANILGDLGVGIGEVDVPDGMESDVADWLEVIGAAVETFAEGGDDDALSDYADGFIREFDAYGALFGLDSCIVGDGRGTAPLDVTEWAAAAQDLCARATDANLDVFTSFNENPVDGAFDMQMFLSSLLAGLRAIEGDPGESGSELLAAMDAFVDAAGDLSDAVSSGDADTFVAAHEALVDATGPVNAAAAAALGAPDCGGY